MGWGWMVYSFLLGSFWLTDRDLYRRHHCLPTLVLLFKFFTSETKGSFVTSTDALLVGTFWNIGRWRQRALVIEPHRMERKQGRTRAGQSIYKTKLTFHSFISNSWRRQEFKKRSIPPKISCKIWLTKEMRRNIFLIFLWNIFAETKFSGLLPNPSSGDFITLNVNRKCGMRKHEKVILDWFWELKVYFKLSTAILAWRMFVTWAFSSNSLHNVAFLRWQHSSNTDVITVIVDHYHFFLPSPSPLSFFRPRAYCKGYYFYSPQSSTVIKSKMAATTILRTRTRFRAPKIRLHCRLLCNGLGGNVSYFPLFFNAESNEETMRVCTW